MDGSGKDKLKVVPLRPTRPKHHLDPRLEELRKILNEDVEPIRDEDDELSDKNVIKCEKKFRKRFGYGFSWHRRHRVALIRLKHEKDLTDREIILFRHAGALRRTPWGVHLDASGWIALWGAFQLAILGLMIAAIVIGVWPQLATSPIKVLKLIGLLVGLLSICLMIYLTFIKPWIIQRRTERQDK